MPLEYNPKNLLLAKQMRKNATPQENRLWYDFLRSYGVRFRRQQPIDNYIADFFCYRAKLVIEVDGTQHYTEKGKQDDALRTEKLEGYDLKVIRITNRQIDANFNDVCRYIDQTVRQLIEEEPQQR